MLLNSILTFNFATISYTLSNEEICDHLAYSGVYVILPKMAAIQGVLVFEINCVIFH